MVSPGVVEFGIMGEVKPVLGCPYEVIYFAVNLKGVSRFETVVTWGI